MMFNRRSVNSVDLIGCTTRCKGGLFWDLLRAHKKIFLWDEFACVVFIVMICLYKPLYTNQRMNQCIHIYITTIWSNISITGHFSRLRWEWLKILCHFMTKKLLYISCKCHAIVADDIAWGPFYCFQIGCNNIFSKSLWHAREITSTWNWCDNW